MALTTVRPRRRYMSRLTVTGDPTSQPELVGLKLIEGSAGGLTREGTIRSSLKVPFIE